jgi:outer membrane protein assembly factor BamA
MGGGSSTSRRPPSATVIVLAAGLLAVGGWSPGVSAQDLEGRLIREIRIGPVRRPDTADLVRRHLASREGEPLRRTTLQEDRRRLDALRLFSSIELEPVNEGDDVVLLVHLKETLRLLPFVGLSITDENGASAGPGFKGINLLGRGSLSSATVKFGGETSVIVGVERPTLTPGLWALDIQLSYRSRRNELFDFDEQATTITARAGWNQGSTLQFGPRAELVWFDTGDADIALSSSGMDRLPAVGAFLTYNSLDAVTNPRSGWFAEVDIGRQFGDAGSWSVMLDGRRSQPLGARATLALSAFTVLQSGVVGEDVPEYMQFALGGGNSVRGWALGSRIGKHQAIGTIEYQYTLAPVRPFTVFGVNLHGGVQAVAFGEVGVAWTEEFDASEAIDGYGFGLRLLFPFVDVVRLDVAFGQPGGGVRTTIGINLKADKQRERVR